LFYVKACEYFGTKACKTSVAKLCLHFSMTDYINVGRAAVAESYDDGYEKGLEKGEAKGVADERTAVALDMLADNKPVEEIVKYSHLPMEKVLELRDSQASFTAKV